MAMHTCRPHHTKAKQPHGRGEAKEEKEEEGVPVALEPTKYTGRLLLGRHALFGRERDAAKDDLPAPGIWGVSSGLLRLKELAGKSVLGYT
jgi:hypothetical protein